MNLHHLLNARRAAGKPVRVALIGAGLFLRSLVKLVTLDVGFDRNNVLLVHANLHNAKVPPEQQPAMFREVESRLRTLPGVISASQPLASPSAGKLMNRKLWWSLLNPPRMLP